MTSDVKATGQHSFNDWGIWFLVQVQSMPSTVVELDEDGETSCPGASTCFKSPKDMMSLSD